MKKLILPGILFTTLSAGAQLYIDNATFFIDNGAVVTVQGDVFSNVNIQAAGTGKLRMGGSTTQNLNLNGNTVPNLQIDNSAANVVLTGAAKVTGVLEFTTGRVQLGAFDLTLASAGSHTGAAAGKFAETNGTGVFKKEIPGAGTYVLPVGNGANYYPVSFQTAGGTYAANAFVAGRSVGSAHPNKHPRSTDFLKSYWKLSYGNTTGTPTMTAVGTYVDPADVTGTEADIKPMRFDGTNWSLGTAQDLGLNTVTAPITASGQDLYAMNKFILSSPKVFLQGAFNSANGLMNDLLRTNAAYNPPNNIPASNIIPTSDPYRTDPYNTIFSHSPDNTVVEVISTDVLKDLNSPENQIVDWVFLELRTNATPSTVVQTRSALLQRDGDVVDIDGVSPIYFKNLDAGSYNLAIKHRNHLGVRTASASAMNLSIPVSKLDFTTSAAASLSSFGVSLAGGKFGMYGANANYNSNVRISGVDATVSDYEKIKTELGASAIKNGYWSSDLNMNRNVRISGVDATVSDFEFLKLVLGSSAIRTQPTF